MLFKDSTLTDYKHTPFCAISNCLIYTFLCIVFLIKQSTFEVSERLMVGNIAQDESHFTLHYGNFDDAIT